MDFNSKTANYRILLNRLELCQRTVERLRKGGNLNKALVRELEDLATFLQSAKIRTQMAALLENIPLEEEKKD